MKTVAYSLFGWLVRSKSARSPNPLAFGVVRVAAGWVVGIGIIFRIFMDVPLLRMPFC
jgi:hypothetical protein